MEITPPSVVIALHGFLGLPDDWPAVLSDLTLEDGSPCQLLTRDLWKDVMRIPSLESAFETWTELFLEDVERLSTAPLLVGYSLGGRLAMHAVIRQPRLFKGVIFVSAHPGLTTGSEREARREHDRIWSERWVGDPWETVLFDWNRQPVLLPPKASVQGDPSLSLERKEEDFERRALARAMQFWSLGRQRDLRSQLTSLPIPTLYVSGDEDLKFTDLIQSWDLGPNARHAVVAAAGHRVPWDRPHAFRQSSLSKFGIF